MEEVSPKRPKMSLDSHGKSLRSPGELRENPLIQERERDVKTKGTSEVTMTMDRSQSKFDTLSTVTMETEDTLSTVTMETDGALSEGTENRENPSCSEQKDSISAQVGEGESSRKCDQGAS